MQVFALPLLVLLGAVTAQAGSSVSNKIYLIRHGEKPSSGDGLSTQGVERSQCLPDVFTAANGYNIGLILAQQPQSDGSQQRPYDTVKPLADSLGLTVDTDCQRDDTDCVTSAVSSFAADSSSDILICWEHKALSDISDALGDQFTYPKSHFDDIFEIVDGSLTSNSPWSEDCPGLDN